MAVEQKPIQLFDRASNQWVDVPSSEITKKIADGTHALPSGMDIPVVSPDGELGSIPAENAEAAFRDGFRWQTPQDIEANTAREAEKSKEENFGGTGFALAHGIGSGASFGLQGVIEDKMGLGSAANEVNQRSPIASTVGNVVGAVANPILGAVGQAARGVGAGVGEAVGGATGLTKAGEALGVLGEATQPAANFGALAEGAAAAAPSLVSKGLTTAGKIVSGLAPNALGSAAEGAFYGLGQGISEAALGDPQHVTENLIGNLKNGFLFGGVLGGGLGVLTDAAPLIKSISRAGVTGIEDIVKSAAQKATSGVLVPTLKTMGKTAEADIVSQLIPQAAERAAIGEHTGDFERVAELAKQAQADAEAHAKELDGNVRAYIDNLPAQTRAEVKAAFADAGGDLTRLRSDLQSNYDSLNSTYRAQLPNMTQDKPQMIGKLYTDAESLVDTLKKSGEAADNRLGNELKNIMNSEIKPQYGALKEFERTPTLTANYPLSTEVSLAHRLMDAAPENTGILSAKAADALEQFKTKTTDALLDHPNDFVSNMEQKLAAQKEALNGFSELVGKTASPGSKLSQIFMDPVKAAKINAVMDNISQFYGEFKGLQSKMISGDARQKLLDSAMNKANALRGDAPGGRFTASDMSEILDAFKAPTKFGDRLTELRELEANLKNAEPLNPIDKYMQIQKALGRDITPDIKDLANLEPTYEALNRLKPQTSGPQGGLTLGKAAVIGLASKLSPALGGALGAVDSVASMGRNPYRTMQTLTAIERFANKGAQRINSATDAVVDALTSPGARRGAMASSAEYYNTSRSLEEREKEFKHQAAFLNQLQDPKAAMDYLGNRIGSWHGAPQIQTQMGTQMMQMAQFLTSKLPHDPLQGKSMMGLKTGWMPSDYELAKFNRYVTAAQDPAHVMTNIAAGIATPEEVETLKTLYPQTFQKLQSKVLDGITQNGDKVSYQQRLAIGTLFGVPTDATLQPDFIGKMQSNYAKDQQQDQGGRPQGKSIKIDLNPDNAVATETTRITNK